VRIATYPTTIEEIAVSKGLDKKKEDKKKPAKNLKEKRAEKAAKKGK
jgi:hypothetical protein